MSVQAIIDGWNARDGGKVAAAFTPDGVRVEYAKPGARLEGRDAIAGQAQGYMTAVPDCVLDVRGLIEQGRPPPWNGPTAEPTPETFPVSRRAAGTSPSPV